MGSSLLGCRDPSLGPDETREQGRMAPFSVHSGPDGGFQPRLENLLAAATASPGTAATATQASSWAAVSTPVPNSSRSGATSTPATCNTAESATAASNMAL